MLCLSEVWWSLHWCLRNLWLFQEDYCTAECHNLFMLMSKTWRLHWIIWGTTVEERRELIVFLITTSEVIEIWLLSWEALCWCKSKRGREGSCSGEELAAGCSCWLVWCGFILSKVEAQGSRCPPPAGFGSSCEQKYVTWAQQKCSKKLNL